MIVATERRGFPVYVINGVGRKLIGSIDVGCVTTSPVAKG
jgi:hypothetical protein